MDIKSKKTILLIEDDCSILDNLKEILQFENFNVATAVNGRDGIVLALDIKPDLIVCDIAMPEMDGFAVLEFLRKTSDLFDVPFIFLTALDTPLDLRKGMILGADDYITKPFEIDTIIQSINTRLQKHKKLKNHFETQIKEMQNLISSTIPHELSSPLNTILGFTYMIKSNFEELDKEEINLMLNNIESSAKRLLRLVNNYTYFLQLQNNPNFLKSESISQITYHSDLIIKNLIEEISKKYKNITCVFHLVETLLAISEEGLMKIIEELADNAFKFSFPNSKIEIFSAISSNYLKLSFINDGITFPKEKVTSIGAFKQFDRKKYEQQGSGLGLAIVKNICDLYQCIFKIDIISNSKTCISIQIPIVTNANI